jgi:hypothetical protein
VIFISGKRVLRGFSGQLAGILVAGPSRLSLWLPRPPGEKSSGASFILQFA